MAQGDPSNSEAELRRQAEELDLKRAISSARQLEGLLPDDTRHMLHELRVHQIELELQNDELRNAQEHLDIARARYFELYDLAPVGYCTVDAAGNILQSNLAAATLFGVTRSALDRQPLIRFVLPADQDVLYLHRKGLTDTGEPQSFDLRMIRSDATQFWAHLEAAAAREVDGSPILRIVISDVTERRLLQTQSELERGVLEHLARGGTLAETLRELVLGYEGLFPGMRGSVLLLDPTGRYLRHGAAPSLPAEYCQAIEGIEIGPAVGSCGAAAHHRRTTIAADIATDPLWHDHKNLALPHGLQACWSVPIMSIHNSVLGTLAFYFDSPRIARAPELTSIEHGAHLASIAIERHQAEAALRRSEAFSLAILDSVSAEIAVLDGDGTIVTVNQPWRKFALENGFEAGIAAPRTDVGTNYLAACSGDVGLASESGTAIRDGIQAVLDGRAPSFSVDYPCHSPQEQRWFTLNVTPMGTVGQGVVVAHTNVTKRWHAEQENSRLEARLRQAERLESVGRLAGGVAHDFNNMLGVVIGHAEIAMGQVGPTHPLHADLMEISAAAQRSAGLTRQLLAFARKQPVAPRTLDLNETVPSMLTMLQRLIGEHISLNWHHQPGLWAVKLDPSQLDQMLTNLCLNARDSITDVGHVTIEATNRTIDEKYCEDHPDSTPGDYVQLVVRDDGRGIEESDIAHLFEPFYTTKPAGMGTGLGLATVYGSVRQNLGFISVSSEPGRGSAFEIHLPRFVGTSESKRAEDPAAPAQRGHETVLFVEDEPALLNLASRVLEAQGYVVLGASGPGEAIRVAQENKGAIDLLVTDVIMPEMNGRDLAVTLLASHPTLKCLFISGYTADVIARHGVLKDGVHFLQKPFSISDIAAKVRDALDAPRS
ncbi:MAG: ATP-binding protein [Candidatus Eisenbacteria bacterium]